MKGWLVNDCLTCIPGTTTFWHHLLEWFPELEDKTFGQTPFQELASRIEVEARTYGEPDYIIRNATYFRRIRLKVHTISLLQDVAKGSLREHQIDVCNASNITVVNSEHVRYLYSDVLQGRIETIPLGVDFEFFYPLEEKDQIREELGILPDSILFVGDSSNYPKGFDILSTVIDETDFNFCLVMKDDYKTDNKRVRVFNKVDEQTMRKIYNACSLLICTSRIETQHLAGIEAAACGLPLLVTNVGAYFNRDDGPWGHYFGRDFSISIQQILKQRDIYQPRQYFLEQGFDKLACQKRWLALVDEKEPEPWKGNVFV